MKIAFDGRVFKHKHLTGVEIYAHALYSRLSQLILLKPIVPLCNNRYLQHLWEHTMLPMRALNADVLFCPANIAPLWISKRTKLVVTLHDVAYLTYPKSVSKIFGAYYRWLIPKILKRANTVITISEASKREILEYYPVVSSKIQVIHNGISAEFAPIAFESKKKTILYVGSLNERKNFASVLNAFHSLPSHLEYRLVVIGNFSSHFDLVPETQKVLLSARKNSRIDFLQDISFERLQKEYAEASLFLFPSFYEGFGFPPLEAMASGTPVITSNISSMPEICGNAALYVDPNNINDIVLKIQRVLENQDLQKQMIEVGLKRAKGFTWEKAAQRYKEELEKVAE